MRQIVVRETITEPAKPVIPWKQELNMPPREWFVGEWMPARMAREEQEWGDRLRERRLEIAAKFALYIAGAAGLVAVLGMYIAAGMWIGGF